MTDVILHVVRIGQLRRCIAETRELVNMLTVMETKQQAVDVAVQQGLQLKSNALATQLMAQRHYMDHGLTFDPRFLVFEYIQNLMLYSTQVIPWDILIGYYDLSKASCYTATNAQLIID